MTPTTARLDAAAPATPGAESAPAPAGAAGGAPIRVPQWVLAAIVVFAGTLAGGEAALRLLWRNPYRQSAVRYVALQEERPNLDLTYDGAPEDGGGTERVAVRFRTDADGFILPSHRYEHPDARIAFLGGSTTQSSSVPELERWPIAAVMQAEQATGRRLDIINAGHVATTSGDLVNVLLNKVVYRDAQVLVFTESINDLIAALSGDDPYRHAVVVPDPARAVAQEASARLSLAGFLRGALAVTTRGDGELRLEQQQDQWRRAPKYEIPSDRLETALRQFRVNVAVLAAAAEQHRMQVVLLSQPSLYAYAAASGDVSRLHFMAPVGDGTASPAAMARAMARFQQAMGEVAAEQHAAYVDLAAALPSDPQLFWDDVHFNRAGSRRAAAVVAERLATVLRQGPGA